MFIYRHLKWINMCSTDKKKSVPVKNMRIQKEIEKLKN